MALKSGDNYSCFCTQTELSWKTLHQIINQTISDMLDEHQSINVLSLRLINNLVECFPGELCLQN
jgi:hypothetical protein